MGIMDLFARIEKEKPKTENHIGSIDYLIVGLGNPDQKYQNTRHNAGYLAIDQMAKQWNTTINRSKYQSLTGTAVVAGHQCLLMKPLTYMNLSGQAVVAAMNFYHIPPTQIILLFDDISLDVGKMRIRRKGSDGGHNGMKNIIYLTGENQFPRVKIGVGKKPNPNYNLADWVLSRFTEQELETLQPVVQDCVQAVELIVGGNIDEAMNRFNG